MNRESLEELLLSSSTGQLSDEERTRLNELLRDDPEARVVAARFLATDALLADALESSSVERRFVSRHRRRTWLSWGMVAVAASVIPDNAAEDLGHSGAIGGDEPCERLVGELRRVVE